MTEFMDRVINRVRQIRQNKHRSIKNCAKVLNISRQDYKAFEKGLYAISLPELETLAAFFEIQVERFFEVSPLEVRESSLLEDSTQVRYRQLRNKMIQARIDMAREKTQVSLEELHEITRIPLATLHAYHAGDTAIPIDHLEQISQALEIPINALLHQPIHPATQEILQESPPEWQQEFPQDRSTPPEQDPFDPLVHAMHQLPKRDQAEIAKILLEKLKAQ